MIIRINLKKIDEKIRNILENAIRKDVLNMAVPIMIEQTFVMLLGVCNTIMASNIGEAEVSAIGMIDSINNMFISFFAALSVGTIVVVAQQLGQGNLNKINISAKQAFMSGLILSIIISIFLWIFKVPIINMIYGSAEKSVVDNAKIYFNFSLITYPFVAVNQITNGILRGVGETKIPMKITIIMNIINIVLGYILIFGVEALKIPSFGIIGASLAIGVSRLIGSMMAIYVLLNGTKEIKIDGIIPFKFEWGIQKDIFTIGIPSGIENILFNAGKVIIQSIVVTMGTYSTAANVIAMSCVSMTYVPGMGLSLAATAIVGQYIGRKDKEGARRILYYMIKFGTFCLVMVGLVMIPLADIIPRLYTSSSEVICITKILIRSNSIALSLYAMSFILSAGLKGAGDTKYTMVTTFIGMWLFRIFIGYIFGIVFEFGVLGVWIGMYMDWLVRGIMYMIRLKGDKWIKVVVT